MPWGTMTVTKIGTGGEMPRREYYFMVARRRRPSRLIAALLAGV
jgi:hypothetical protein